MKDLNTVLLEGEIVGHPHAGETDDAGWPKVTLRVACRGERSVSGVPTVTRQVFSVKVRGRLAEVCRKHLTAGREVRAVGRLVTVDHLTAETTDVVDPERTPVWIAAEEVEFKRKPFNDPNKPAATRAVPLSEIAAHPSTSLKASDYVSRAHAIGAADREYLNRYR